MKRLRELFESIAFVGLKPSGQKTSEKSLKWLGPLARPIDRFLSGAAPNDPLYLTNRTFGQKLKSWSIIAIPCLILAVGVGVTLSNILNPPEAKQAAELTAKEISAKLLPNLDPNLKLDLNSDLEAVEVKVEHIGGSRVSGVVRNRTDHDIASAHVILDLADTNGSQVGGVEVPIQNIPAQKTKTFSHPIAQPTAAFALVRELGPVH